MSGVKHDQQKARVDLIPARALLDVGMIFTHGAQKYGDRNWQEGIEFSRLFGAAQRHLLLWKSGEDIDTDSGLPHLAHALTNLFMIAGLAETHPECDDRQIQRRN